jgi:hypothetical protein
MTLYQLQIHETCEQISQHGLTITDDEIKLKFDIVEEMQNPRIERERMVIDLALEGVRANRRAFIRNVFEWLLEPARKSSERRVAADTRELF